jgi:hypothetical protein
MKKITIAAYDKKISKIIKETRDKPIDEVFIALIEEASKYKIVSKRRPKHGY